MKTIWIIDHYSSEPQHAGISRQYDFAKQLSKMGYRIVVVASAFSHFTHSYISEKEIEIVNFAYNAYYVYLRTPAYSGNDGLARARNMVSFSRQVTKHRGLIEKECGRPDTILGCSVHPLTWVAAYKIAKKYGIRFCVEVRDFWPRIWVASGDKSKFHPMVIFFSALQKWACSKADRIVYSMHHGDKYLCGEMKIPREKVFLIGQPMDCERFDRNKANFESLPQDIQQFAKDGFVCTFAGYYMAYEGVYVILDAARILMKRNIPAKFVFVGSGQAKDGMVQFVRDNNLSRVIISDRIPKESVPALLSHSSVCIAHLEVEGRKDVYKYGVSKNKVNEYLYSGACTLYGFLYKDDAVATSGGGVVIEPHNSIALADEIEKIYRMNVEERRQYGVNGRNYIKEHHSVDVLASKLLKVLFD